MYLSTPQHRDEGGEKCAKFLLSPAPTRINLSMASPPAVLRIARPTLGRNLASLLVANHFLPNLCDDASGDDDTLSLVDSASGQEDLDVFRLDEGSAYDRGSHSATLLPQTVGDPTRDPNFQDDSPDESNDVLAAPNALPLHVVTLQTHDELATRSCHTSNSQPAVLAVSTLHRRRCHSVDDTVILTMHTIDRRRH